ncbi:uncharacterized protein LOC114576018 [Exaiptasia diaphana]|uniref:Uncharacterized protein n=1 Tax=Exaiptasia diaphana TaxID=2652724 RepID=A0A913YT99_EXADI|nr:uncharacterized protein LOC114576018 [Exaiptasia diaphana]
MFHQVKVNPADYDAFRFLWWPDDDLSKDPVDYRMEVHLFGATSSPSCSSYALQRTAHDYSHLFSDEAVSTVKNNFYVDDCLKSVKTSEEAISLVKELTDMLSMGGFRLTKWLSNDPDVIGSIPESERSAKVLDLDMDKERLPVERTLGLKWDMHADKFIFDVMPKEKPATRRGILSVTSSVYDPLGFPSQSLFVIHTTCSNWKSEEVTRRTELILIQFLRTELILFQFLQADLISQIISKSKLLKFF